MCIPLLRSPKAIGKTSRPGRGWGGATQQWPTTLPPHPTGTFPDQTRPNCACAGRWGPAGRGAVWREQARYQRITMDDPPTIGGGQKTARARRADLSGPDWRGNWGRSGDGRDSSGVRRGTGRGYFISRRTPCISPSSAMTN